MTAHGKPSTQPYLAIITMTERHRVQWLRMLAQLQAAQAPAPSDRVLPGSTGEGGRGVGLKLP